MEDIVTVTEAEKPTRKRNRSATKKPKPKEPATGTGVNIVGNRFACSYSGKLTERAIFIPGVSTAAFANLPCAAAWLRDTVTDPEQRKHLFEQMCDEYEQDVAAVQDAPTRTLLADFGGYQSYDEWIGALTFWDMHTAGAGMSVPDYQAALGGKTTARGKTPAPTKLILERGMQVITHGPKPTVKRVNATDGAVEKGVKGQLTPVGIYTKLHSFVIKNKAPGIDLSKPGVEPRWSQEVFVADGGLFMAHTAVDFEPDAKLRNHAADSAFDDGRTYYAPLVAITTRKISVSTKAK